MIARLASPKLAAALIGVLLAACVVAFVVPQQSHSALSLYQQWSQANPDLARVAHAVGFDDVFSSPLFLVALALLAVNLIACTSLRVARYANRTIVVPSGPPASAVRVDGVSAEEAHRIMRARMPLWSITRVDEGDDSLIFADRRTAGFLGSLVLHLGILLVIVGGAVSGVTRFDGRMVLTEGETLSDVRGSYMGTPSEPRLGDAYGDFWVRLDSLRFDYEAGQITQAHAQMTFADDSQTAVRQGVVNGPARWQGKSFLLVKGGHAAALRITDAGGNSIVPDSVYRLGNAVEGGYEDTVELPDGRVLAVRSTADAADPAAAKTEPLALRDPAVTLSLEQGSVASETVRPGQTVSLDGVAVTLGDVRLWNEFAVRQDRGIPVTYTAFAIILIGTVIRVWFGKAVARCLVQRDGSVSSVFVWSGDQYVTDRIVGMLARVPETTETI